VCVGACGESTNSSAQVHAVAQSAVGGEAWSAFLIRNPVDRFWSTVPVAAVDSRLSGSDGNIESKGAGVVLTQEVVHRRNVMADYAKISPRGRKSRPYVARAYLSVIPATKSMVSVSGSGSLAARSSGCSR
jgi:hypothetical protein